MEIIILLLIAIVFILPIAAMVTASGAKREAAALRHELSRMQNIHATQIERINKLSSRVSELIGDKPAPAPKPLPEPEKPVFVPPPAYLEPAPQIEVQPEMPKMELKRNSANGLIPMKRPPNTGPSTR